MMDPDHPEPWYRVWFWNYKNSKKAQSEYYIQRIQEFKKNHDITWSMPAATVCWLGSIFVYDVVFRLWFPISLIAAPQVWIGSFCWIVLISIAVHFRFG
ncbi:MAG: hypothetical protein ACTSUE_08070 [Promethearchaeota archaeon]